MRKIREVNSTEAHLAIKICVCYNAIRQKDMSIHMYKERIPQLYPNTVEGFFFSFVVAKHPLGYLLSLSLLSSHLMMRWQTTPPITVTKSDMSISICTPPPVVGYRLDNKPIISRISAIFYNFPMGMYYTITIFSITIFGIYKAF